MAGDEVAGFPTFFRLIEGNNSYPPSGLMA